MHLACLVLSRIVCCKLGMPLDSHGLRGTPALIIMTFTLGNSHDAIAALHIPNAGSPHIPI